MVRIGYTAMFAAALLLAPAMPAAAFGTCVWIEAEERAVFDGRIVLKLESGRKSKVAGRWRAVEEGFACVGSWAPLHLEHEVRGRLVSLFRRGKAVPGSPIFLETSEFDVLSHEMVTPSLSLLFDRLGLPFDEQASIKSVGGSIDEIAGKGSRLKLKGHLDVVFYRMGRKKRAKLKFRLDGDSVPR